jgi:hypothetical protein
MYVRRGVVVVAGIIIAIAFTLMILQALGVSWMQ